MVEVLNYTLQENLITMLGFDDVHGKVVSQLLEPSLFEGEYRTIAERCLVYWQKHNQAPKAHLPDLFDDILSDKDNRKGPTFKRMLKQMHRLSGEMNTKYVIEQLRKFSRLQRLKDGILRSAERLNANQETAITEVEQIWNDLLRVREIDFDRGLRLTDIDSVLSFLETKTTEFSVGIPYLDRRGIVPARGAISLFLAMTGRGKSWWLAHLGRQALMQRKKVLHISLEMSAEMVVQRYYQNLFAIAKRSGEYHVIGFDKDTNDYVTGFEFNLLRPEVTLDSLYIRDELETRLSTMPARFEQCMIIKRFPPRQLTIPMLNAYLDNLEVVEHFIPDMIILDYIGIMKTDARNHRISLGRVYEDLRGVAVERNVALETAHQTSKDGARTSHVDLTHVAEDWSLIATSDLAYTYSQTKVEKKYGLARLYVGKARDDEDKFSVLLSQNYATGQFVLDSALLRDSYFDMLKDQADADEEHDDGMSEDYDDDEDDHYN